MKSRSFSLAMIVLFTACGTSQKPPAEEPLVVGAQPVAEPSTNPSTNPNPNPTANPNSWTDADLEYCVTETNRYRAMHNKPAVKRDAKLEACAFAGAKHDHAARVPHDHFAKTNGCGISYAENELPWWDVSYGGGTVQGTLKAGLEMMYAEGPGGGHYENMLSDNTLLGCGIHIEGGQITVVQDFGR